MLANIIIGYHRILMLFEQMHLLHFEFGIVQLPNQNQSYSNQSENYVNFSPKKKPTVKISVSLYGSAQANMEVTSLLQSIENLP